MRILSVEVLFIMLLLIGAAAAQVCHTLSIDPADVSQASQPSARFHSTSPTVAVFSVTTPLITGIVPKALVLSFPEHPDVLIHIPTDSMACTVNNTAGVCTESCVVSVDLTMLMDQFPTLHYQPIPNPTQPEQFGFTLVATYQQSVQSRIAIISTPRLLSASASLFVGLTTTTVVISQDPVVLTTVQMMTIDSLPDGSSRMSVGLMLSFHEAPLIDSSSTVLVRPTPDTESATGISITTLDTGASRVHSLAYIPLTSDADGLCVGPGTLEVDLDVLMMGDFATTHTTSSVSIPVGDLAGTRCSATASLHEDSQGGETYIPDFFVGAAVFESRTVSFSGEETFGMVVTVLRRIEEPSSSSTSTSTRLSSPVPSVLQSASLVFHTTQSPSQVDIERSHLLLSGMDITDFGRLLGLSLLKEVLEQEEEEDHGFSLVHDVGFVTSQALLERLVPATGLERDSPLHVSLLFSLSVPYPVLEDERISSGINFERTTQAQVMIGQLTEPDATNTDVTDHDAVLSKSTTNNNAQFQLHSLVLVSVLGGGLGVAGLILTVLFKKFVARRGPAEAKYTVVELLRKPLPPSTSEKPPPLTAWT